MWAVFEIKYLKYNFQMYPGLRRIDTQNVNKTYLENFFKKRIDIQNKMII